MYDSTTLDGRSPKLHRIRRGKRRSRPIRGLLRRARPSNDENRGNRRRLSRHLWCICSATTDEIKKMMYLETPPRLIETRVFSAMPEALRRKGVATQWADANRPGQPTDSFIEGPCFDADGNLYIVDIPFGRIFRIAPDGTWSLVIEYDGWPNGLKIRADGRIFVADYRHGIMELDLKTARMLPVLTARNSEVLQGVQRPASGLEWRHLFHRPGTDRAARSDRPRLSAVARWPARLSDRYRHQSQRPGARSRPRKSVRGDDPRQRGLAACRS